MEVNKLARTNNEGQEIFTKLKFSGNDDTDRISDESRPFGCHRGKAEHLEYVRQPFDAK